MVARFSALSASHTLLSERFLILISVRDCVDRREILWLEESSELKNTMTSWEIKITAFRISV
jgi:hypothetical protein